MKRLILFLTLLTAVLTQAQQRWNSYLSYAEIVAMASGKEEVFAATTASVLVFNIVREEIEIYNTINGLHTGNITALHYSEPFKKIIVGNEDGSLQIIDRKNGKISFIDDIKNKGALMPGEKKINAFAEQKGIVYIAANYGISALNLNNNQFGDSYFLGNSGKNQAVISLAIQGQTIYAVTESEGVKKALLSNPNLVDYNQWQLFVGGKWDKTIVYQDKLLLSKNEAETDAGELYQVINNSGLTQLAESYDVPITDLKQSDNYLLITTKNTVDIKNKELLSLNKIETVHEKVTAEEVGNKLYVGTPRSGLLQFDWGSWSAPVYLSPEGPETNRIFSMLSTDSGIWFVAGGYDKYTYNPHIPFLGFYGLDFYSKNRGWERIPYSKLNAQALSFAVINPRNKSQLFVASYHSGLLKIDLKEENLGESTVYLYNDENSGNEGLESLRVNEDYKTTRINGVAFDREGLLWVTNNFITRSLKSLNPAGDWKSYNFTNYFPDYTNVNYGRMVIDKNDTKWIPTLLNGIVAFNEKRGNRVALFNQQKRNLPSDNVSSLAIDKSNQLWIGTEKGLRLVTGVDKFLQSTDIATQSIIIKQDGIAQELFYQQYITKIKVDGANNKWVAVADAGVFLVSSNGQKIIHHFTRENSPLPSNTINDIEIDGTTGEVFFATDLGVVSFMGDASEGQESYSDFYVYPNPVRPEFFGDVKIAGLVDKSNVKIVDLDGNLVFETTSEGGMVLWDTYGFNGRRVSSGVYLVLVSSGKGEHKAVKKLMIIR